MMENELRLSGTNLNINNQEFKPKPTSATSGSENWDRLEKCDISICAWNVEGLSQCLKESDFLNCVCTVDIFFVSETWQRSLNNYETEGF